MPPLRAGEIEPNLSFEIGQRYVREDLHEVCGGNKQPGISPITDLSAIFLFASTDSTEYGYRDEWLPNGHFLLTGVGQEGDQSWSGLNKSLATHAADGRRVFLFERVPDREPTVVTYVGEVEYVTHREDTLPDVNGDMRTVYRFELRPVGGDEVESPVSLAEASLEELYAIAERAAPDGSPAAVRSTKQTYARSEAVRAFALRMADGVCQGCEEPAPFEDDDGEPYLEVHHLHRLSDAGPDHPDNVIALCPNCHARVHNGANGEAFNQTLISRAEARSP
jgi:5-methylcytosine-specific restriction protein A